LTIDVSDVLDIMCTTPTLFKSLIYITLEEFDQLNFQILLTNKAHVISIGEFPLSYLFPILT
jgi:hypothetical protein